MATRTAIMVAALLFTAAKVDAQARADLKDTQGKDIGTAAFRETKEGVAISVQVKGLPPGLHAVHVHEVGKCEAPKFASAGGHFNPMKNKHGLKSQDGPHAGDLPNMYVTKDGGGRFETMADGMALKSGETSLFDENGSAIVIHAAVDDYTTDPTGNAGDRIACGVITKAAAKK